MEPLQIAEIFGPIFSVGLSALAPFILLPFLVLFSGRFGAEIAGAVTSLIEPISAAAETIALILMAVLAVLVGAVVMLRYGFGVSSNLLSEGALYAHSFAFMLAAAACLGRDGHVRVDVFYSHWGAKRKAAANLTAYTLFAAPMLIAILHFSTPYVAQAWRIGERSPEADGLPLLFLLKTAIPIFAVLLLAQAVAEACRNAAVLRGLPPAARRFQPDEAAQG
jgi:TRAP-type mannitol/chloroaromatic compound transport system permease small subunit